MAIDIYVYVYIYLFLFTFDVKKVRFASCFSRLSVTLNGDN